MKGNFTDSRIVTLLAQTGQEDFNPGKGGRIARFGGGRVQVAANEAAHEKGPGTRTSRALLQWVSLESAQPRVIVAFSSGDSRRRRPVQRQTRRRWSVPRGDAPH